LNAENPKGLRDRVKRMNRGGSLIGGWGKKKAANTTLSRQPAVAS